MEKTSPVLLVISAPSGGGKTTVCQHLLADNPHLTRAITCTTRSPREGEKDGVDYYFLDPPAFLRRVQVGDFLEHAMVYGNSYGTLKSEVLEKLRQGQDVLLTVDVQGVASIRNQAQHDLELKRALVTVFLTPPTLRELEGRLRRRGTDTEGVRRKRLSVARQEIAQWKNFDYLIRSTTISEDVRHAQVILDAEKMRQVRVEPPEYEVSLGAEVSSGGATSGEPNEPCKHQTP
jgi:guanylate kinase